MQIRLNPTLANRAAIMVELRSRRWSPKMVAMVECALEVPMEYRIASPKIYELHVTSDGFVLGVDSEQRSPFLGTLDDWTHNLAALHTATETMVAT